MAERPTVMSRSEESWLESVLRTDHHERRGPHHRGESGADLANLKTRRKRCTSRWRACGTRFARRRLETTPAQPAVMSTIRRLRPGNYSTFECMRRSRKES